MADATERLTVATLLHDTALDAVETRVLLQHVLDVNHAWLISHNHDLLTPEALERFQGLRQARQQGMPIAYLTGEREFYSLSFHITPAVLIPRPETELLVELGLALYQPGWRILDLGTGSGAVAISLAHRLPHADITAIDASAAALAIAQENAIRLQCAPLKFCLSDWFSALDNQRYDLMLANPPYLDQTDPHLTQGDLRFEPQQALVAAEEGLAALRHIIYQAPNFLNPGGWLIVEHGYNQAKAVRQCFEQTGFKQIRSERDLAGIERMSLGQSPSVPNSSTADSGRGLQPRAAA